MSTQQIVGTLAFAAGAFTGNPQLMLYGATTALSPGPGNTQGPRLGDLKVQSSTYGNAIPRVYGAMRIAGNMIWSAPITETSHEESAGKGGGPTNTTYTYSQSFAVALCEGEITGVRKIWANGKLIYNLSDDVDASTITASNNLDIRVYTGSETQLPDSLIEASESDAPAYRGTAYVVFENLQLQDYGNRTPNLEFEVVKAGDVAASVKATSSGIVYGGVLRKTLTGYVTTDFYGVQILTSSLIGGKTYSYPSGRIGESGNPIVDDNGDVYVTDVSTGIIRIRNGILKTLGIGTWGAICLTDNYIIQAPWNSVAVNVYDKESYALKFTGSSSIYNGAIACYQAISGDIYIIYGDIGGSGHKPYICRFRIIDDSIITISEKQLTSNISIFAFGEMHENSQGEILWWGQTQYPYVTGKVVICKYNPETNTETSYLSAGLSVPSISYNRFTDSFFYTKSDGVLAEIDAVTLIEVGTHTVPSGLSVDTATWLDSAVLACTLSGNYVIIHLGGLDVSSVSVASIVSDICSDVGLTEIDTSALTDTLTGYVIANRGTARAAIEPLARAFFFDAVESAGVVKFVKRGGSSVVAIPQADLAAHEYGSSPPDPVALDRKQEVELPQEINVSYMDESAAYQVGSQYSRRLIGASENKTTIQLAMAISASKAKQVADVLLYDAWQGRTSLKFQTTNKYSYLEPTDVVQIEKDGTYYTARIVDKDEQGGIITFSAVHEDLQIYDQNAVAPSLPAPDESVAPVGLTNLVIMDIPLLRDQDDGDGFYVAAAGISGSWGGAQMFKSIDDGASWTQFGRIILNDSTIGAASTALGNFGHNIFDETNSVTVVLQNGELSSATELAVLNGGNVALLGDEIIQFRDATLIAEDTYTLTGLLRGRHGTEWAMGTHEIGERFVLLGENTTYLMPAGNSEFGVARKYVGVTFGGFLDDAIVHDLTFYAVAQECYAPVHLGGGRNAAGDLTLTWIRRSRIGGAWTNYADVPLGETSEAYEVDIYDDAAYSNVVRTISASTQTASYSAADQVSDFGSVQPVVYWKVYQLSDTNGRGYEAKGAT